MIGEPRDIASHYTGFSLASTPMRGIAMNAGFGLVPDMAQAAMPFGP